MYSKRFVRLNLAAALLANCVNPFVNLYYSKQNDFMSDSSLSVLTDTEFFVLAWTGSKLHDAEMDSLRTVTQILSFKYTQSANAIYQVLACMKSQSFSESCIKRLMLNVGMYMKPKPMKKIFGKK